MTNEYIMIYACNIIEHVFKYIYTRFWFGLINQKMFEMDF
jgi:hypothetical protein